VVRRLAETVQSFSLIVNGTAMTQMFLARAEISQSMAFSPAEQRATSNLML
jgi:hypothetical protein